MTEFATRHGGIWVRSFGTKPASVVALHGFTLHGGMFKQLASLVDVGVAAPDLPGHGKTTVNPITMRTAVDSLAELLGSFDDPPLLLGYSQGGRIALQVALTYPDLVGSLVLVASSAGLDDRARALRRAADDGLASRIERIGIDRFIDEWLAKPMVTTDHIDAALRTADRALRLENTAEGLAEALRGMGQASVGASLGRIADLTMPVTFLAGRLDSKYSEEAIAMAATRGRRPVLVDNAGHNLILEAPDAVAATINQLR